MWAESYKPADLSPRWTDESFSVELMGNDPSLRVQAKVSGLRTYEIADRLGAPNAITFIKTPQTDRKEKYPYIRPEETAEESTAASPRANGRARIALPTVPSRQRRRPKRSGNVLVKEQRKDTLAKLSDRLKHIPRLE
jgi:hypothetical protein